MWKDLLKTVAPTLATALGGPLAGMATKWLAGSLIGNEDASEEEIEKWIVSANPDQLLELKKIDQDFAARMKELDIDLEKMHQADRASARVMAAVDMRPQIALSVLFTGGYFLIVTILIWNAIEGNFNIPQDAQLFIGSLLGLMTAEIPRVNAFWFGSSSGSKEKTAAMQNGKDAE